MNRPLRNVLTIGIAWTLSFEAFADLRIAEFQAKNLASLDDEQLASSDWVEIRNEGGSEVDLQGYYLTDDPENLDKWVFPSLKVGAGDEITVFASGKDQHTRQTLFQQSNPIKPTHTNFKLSSAGDSTSV